jgi:hypothetical protein
MTTSIKTCEWAQPPRATIIGGREQRASEVNLFGVRRGSSGAPTMVVCLEQLRSHVMYRRFQRVLFRLGPLALKHQLSRGSPTTD